jgi:hypothetical protein
MGTKERLHEMMVTSYLAPIASVKTADMAVTNALDTEGFESNMFVLQLGIVAADCDYVVKMYESNTSKTDAGTQVAVADMIVAVSDNDAGTIAKIDANGVLTLSAAADGARAIMFAYKGAKRWIRLVATSTGGKSAVVSMIAIQGDFRYRGRAGLYTEVLAPPG